jgi:hypothetical protein
LTDAVDRHQELLNKLTTAAISLPSSCCAIPLMKGSDVDADSVVCLESLTLSRTEFAAAWAASASASIRC